MTETINIAGIFTLGLGLVFYITLLIFIGFTLSIIYHWFAYGIHKTRILIMMTIYLVVSALLLLAMSLTYNML